jgi:hypothetical protein
MSTSIPKIEWEIVLNALSDEQRARIFDLAFRLMPSEPPEPGDLEALKGYEPRERFSFSSAKEIADYFGIPE